VCGRHPWTGHKIDCPNRESCTPVTTEFVRRHYSMAPTAYRTDGSIAQMPSVEDVAYCERQFDEWLARHDAEVRAAALSSPPADDVREALAAALADNRKLRRLLAAALDAEVRLRGTVTDAEPAHPRRLRACVEAWPEAPDGYVVRTCPECGHSPHSVGMICWHEHCPCRGNGGAR
jgi:hypothetical protein